MGRVTQIIDNFPCTTDCIIYLMCRTECLKIQHGYLELGFSFPAFSEGVISHLFTRCSLFRDWWYRVITFSKWTQTYHFQKTIN